MELGGVEIGRLNKDGLCSVTDAGQPGLILWDKDVAIVGFTIRQTRD